DFAGLAQGLWRKRPEAWRMTALLAVASLPAAVLGYFFHDLFTSVFLVRAVAVGWLVTTALLWLTPPPQCGTQMVEDLSWGQALAVGVLQACALWPGLSRSGSTIFMGRMVGLAPKEAARFSFLMAVPVIVGAGFLTFTHSVAWQAIPVGPLLVGTAVAAISGLWALRWVKYAVSHRLSWQGFGLYTLSMAIFVLLWSR
ncbi:MAG: undecaprenyl-diphosphate phosphatase, partial [Firmicutes bacterium]|nr:undecaprenyl-diphosphate phosphatase [Bacillota bacterium]